MREPAVREARSRLFLFLALWTLVGCTPPGITVSTGPVQTTVTGRFDGELRGDAGCAWVETSSSERIEILYPNGWHVEFDPVALYDDSGRLRARAGDALTVEGYFSEVGASVCQPERMFNAIKLAAQSP